MVAGRDFLVRACLDFILPTGCVSCRRWISSAESADGTAALVCLGCRSRLRVGSWPRCGRCHAPRGTGRDPGSSRAECLECRGWPRELAGARYACTLVPPATDLVHALKYEGWRELADFMGRRMAATALTPEPGTGGVPERESASTVGWPAFTHDAVVVAIPTTKARIRTRGYNQAGLLAEVVARQLGRPTVHDALVRRAGGASQTTLSPERRRENVRDVFEAGSEVSSVRGRAVLLVDDVLTTGATAAEAAKTLAGIGAREVRLLTFGRAMPGRDSREDAA